MPHLAQCSFTALQGDSKATRSRQQLKQGKILLTYIFSQTNHAEIIVVEDKQQNSGDA